MIEQYLSEHLAVSYDTFALGMVNAMGFLSLLVMHGHIKDKLFEIESKIEELGNDD